MKSRRELVKNGIINENSNFSHNYVVLFYRKQLIKFDKIGIGRETENGVIVTPELIEITKYRLSQLSPLTNYITRERNEKGKV